MGLILVVNLHGSINSSAPVRKALNELWVARKFSASAVSDDAPTVGMLRLCKDYVAWAPLEEGRESKEKKNRRRAKRKNKKGGGGGGGRGDGGKRGGQEAGGGGRRRRARPAARAAGRGEGGW